MPEDPRAYAAALYETIQNNRSTAQKHEWSKPQQISRRFHRWLVQDKISVPVSQKGDDLWVTLTGLHLFANLFAQVFRKVRA